MKCRDAVDWYSTCSFLHLKLPKGLNFKRSSLQHAQHSSYSQTPFSVTRYDRDIYCDCISMSRKCYIVLGIHHDKRNLSPFLQARNSDVFENIMDGNNALAVQLSAVENRLRGGHGDICPDGSRDSIIDYESTVGQRSVRLWSAKIITSLHLYYWKLRERDLEAPSDRARIVINRLRGMDSGFEKMGLC